MRLRSLWCGEADALELASDQSGSDRIGTDIWSSGIDSADNGIAYASHIVAPAKSAATLPRGTGEHLTAIGANTGDLGAKRAFMSKVRLVAVSKVLSSQVSGMKL